MAIDKGTTLRTKVSWARILVKNVEMTKPSVTNILEGVRSFKVQIWWELLPRRVGVFPAKDWKEQPKKGTEEEDKVHTRASKCVGIPQKKSHDGKQKEKMGELEIRNDRGRPSVEVERTLYPIDDPDGSGSDSNFGLALPRPNQKGVEGRNLDGLGSFIGLGLSKPKSLNLEGRMRMRLGPTKSLDSKGYEGSILLAEGLR